MKQMNLPCLVRIEKPIFKINIGVENSRKDPPHTMVFMGFLLILGFDRFKKIRFVNPF